MEGNGLRGGVFSNLSPGILGLEMPIQQQQNQHQHQQQAQNNNPHHFHPQMVAFGRVEQPPLPHLKQQQQQHQQQLHHQSDDEDGSMDDNKRKPTSSSSSPWHRMKWTDSMVRLLIMAVYYIGDDTNSDATATNSNEGRKKGGSLMQKKGKWKSVSKAMMEKGFYVSPQQCEDKFNDLNKRYKRVNEILGKGTACKVVENQSLLDQMDHLSVKAKEEAKKLLNSKHLFFREMCAYHNSCGNGASGAGHHSPETQQVHHHSISRDTADMRAEAEHNISDNESENEDDMSEEEESEQLHSTKRAKEYGVGIGLGQGMTCSFEAEIREVIEDVRISGWEKKRWMKMRMVKVEEERVGKEKEGLEIEKERLKWVKYCGKKEREMERKRLKNERAKLECDRMVLLLKHKEFEIMSVLKKKGPEPQPLNSVTGC